MWSGVLCRAGIVFVAVDYPWSSAAARFGVGDVPPWLDLDVWSQHWSREEWVQMLQDEGGDAVTSIELQEATLTGHPLGRALVERLEKEMGKRLRRGKAGRPRMQRAVSAQSSLFDETV